MFKVFELTFTDLSAGHPFSYKYLNQLLKCQCQYTQHSLKPASNTTSVVSEDQLKVDFTVHSHSLSLFFKNLKAEDRNGYYLT